jgi:hypothetical protein
VTIDQPLPSARKLSAKGRRTEFANLYAACEKLSDAEKADLDALRVIPSPPA